MQTITDLKTITCDHGDYRATFDGNTIGFFSNKLDAENALNDYTLDLCKQGLIDAAVIDNDPFADPRSDEERRAEEEKWIPCEGGWECFLLDPFGSDKIIRHFQPRLFDATIPDDESLPNPIPGTDPPHAGRAIARQWHRTPRQFIATLRQLDEAAWYPLAAAYAEWDGADAAAVLDIWLLAVQGANVPANARA